MAYEKLRKRVYEILYSDGISIEFGCEVIYLKEVGQIFKFYKELNGKYNLSVRVQDMSVYPSSDNVEILGKPLTLQDILRAINTISDIEGFHIYDDGSAGYDKIGFGYRKILDLDLDLVGEKFWIWIW